MAATVDAPRRRNEKSRQAIVTATRELLLLRGFDKLTIEAVATRAGVGKQTIYRWWPSRHALAADVILADADRILRPVPATADVEADLCAWAVELAAALTTVRGNAMLRFLTIAGIEHPETGQRLRAGFSTPLRDAVRARLRSHGYGEAVAADATDAIVGGIVQAVLTEGREFPTVRGASITRTVLAGLTAR